MSPQDKAEGIAKAVTASRKVIQVRSKELSAIAFKANTTPGHIQRLIKGSRL